MGKKNNGGRNLPADVDKMISPPACKDSNSFNNLAPMSVIAAVFGAFVVVF